MTFLESIVSDLRDKRLWPIAIALLLALVAIPLLLTSKTQSAPLPPAQITPLAIPVSRLAALPAVSEQPVPTFSKLTGPGHDPFIQQKLAAPQAPSAPKSTGTSSGASKGSGASSSSSGSSAGGSASSSGTSSSAGGGSSSGSTEPIYLTYTVDLVLQKGKGHPTTLHDVSRLTPLPGTGNPFLVFLGVKTDHTTATFLVSSQAKAAGQGKCIPNARQCQFLDLQTGQHEAFLLVGADGKPTVYTLLLSAIRLKTTTSASAVVPSGQSSVGGLFQIPSAAWFGNFMSRARTEVNQPAPTSANQSATDLSGGTTFGSSARPNALSATFPSH